MNVLMVKITLTSKLNNEIQTEEIDVGSTENLARLHSPYPRDRT